MGTGSGSPRAGALVFQPSAEWTEPGLGLMADTLSQHLWLCSRPGASRADGGLGPSSLTLCVGSSEGQRLGQAQLQAGVSTGDTP